MNEDCSFRQGKFTSQIMASGCSSSSAVSGQADGGADAGSCDTAVSKALSASGTIPANSACVLVDRKGKTRKNGRSPFFTLQADGNSHTADHGEESGRPSHLQVLTNLTDASAAGFLYLDFTGHEQGTISVRMMRCSENNPAGKAGTSGKHFLTDSGFRRSHEKASATIRFCLDRPDGPAFSTIRVSSPASGGSAPYSGVSGIHGIYLVFDGFHRQDALISFTFT